jgi:hypothetical protein
VNRVVALAIASSTLALSGTDSRASAQLDGCPGTRVHYQPYRGLNDPGLRPLPWAAATPTSSGIVGHLFYYAGSGWAAAKSPDLRVYAGGSDRNGHNMKVLWRPRVRGAGNSLRIVGAQLDGSASFVERWPAIGGGLFPSTVNVPVAGCWLLTLQTGKLTATVTVTALTP